MCTATKRSRSRRTRRCRRRPARTRPSTTSLSSAWLATCCARRARQGRASTAGDLLLAIRTSGKIALYPIDLYNGATDCADGPAAAPSAGTYSWGGSACAPCIAHHKYACACDGADGTIKCNELGELGTCDCDTPYVVAPPSPPPGAPPEAGMTLAQPLDIVLPLSIAIGCGAVVGMILRHRALHQARLRRAYDQLLNAGTVRPQGSDEVTNSGTRSGDYTPAR